MTRKLSRLHIDLLCVAVICAIFATTDDVVMRTLASVPLIFFLPGSSLLRALKWEAAMPLQRQTMEVGLSIAITIFGGFVLNELGQLYPFGWAIWFSAVVIVASSIATIRGGTTASPTITLQWPGPRTIIIGIAFVLAVGTTVATFRWKINADSNYHPFRFTEFWMVPLRPNDQGAFTIGIANQETKPIDFDVEVRLDGVTLAVWRSLTIKPGNSTTRIVTVPEAAAERERRVTAWLFKSGDPSYIYRQASAVLAPQATPR